MTERILWDCEALVLLAIAVVALPSSIWMLSVPLHWYQVFPWQIPDFGDFNVHFVRDLGSAYLTWSVACIWAALSPSVRFPIVAVTALFFVAHAVVHIFDTLRGHVHTGHFMLDFPSTYLPAILLVWVLYSTWRRRADVA